MNKGYLEATSCTVLADNKRPPSCLSIDDHGMATTVVHSPVP